MPQRPLTREAILRQALELADREGLGALSMRRLGRELGVEAMSLYRHVASKPALLEGLVELVLDEARVDSSPGEPRAVLRDWAHAFRAAARRHPEVVRLFATEPLATPAWGGAVEALLAVLRDAGASDEAAVHAYRLVTTFATGYVLWELRQREQPAARRLPAPARPGRVPGHPRPGGRPCATSTARPSSASASTPPRRGSVRLRSAGCAASPPIVLATRAQTYRERGRRGATTIRFDYRVPNG